MSEAPATADDALNLTSPSSKFFVDEAANIYGIKFQEFRLRDMDSGETLMEVSKEEREQLDQMMAEEVKLAGGELSDDEKMVEYNFGPTFLDLRTIGMQVGFSVGDKPVKNLRLVEKHFFKGECVKTYDFKFGFCIPGSHNVWEAIYDLPELTEDRKLEMISSPGESVSDSYFFVEDKLIIHQRCRYNYH